jgi:hypothetical protein
MPMRKPERLLVLLWLWCSLYAGAAWGAALEVAQDERVSANTALRLCVTLPQAALAQAQSGDCLPDAGASQSPLNVSRGVDAQHAFWLQLALHNSGNQPLERWLQVGHPRLEEVSLFLPDGTRLDAGIRTPMAQRADVPRHYGVLPVSLPAQGSQTVWLRVYSRTLVDLGVTVWSPNAYRESMGLNHLSLTLALGSLMAALLYALATCFSLWPWRGKSRWRRFARVFCSATAGLPTCPCRCSWVRWPPWWRCWGLWRFSTPWCLVHGDSAGCFRCI